MAIKDGKSGSFNPIGNITQETLEEEIFKNKLARKTKGEEVEFTAKELQRLREMAQTGEQIEVEIDIERIKDTNPKDAIGVRKTSFSCLPLLPLAEAAVGMHEGAFKYGKHNYRKAGIRASVYFDAVVRHIFQWWEGEDIDPDSGVSHVTKAITTLLVLRDGMMNNLWSDDRPLQSSNKTWLIDCNAKTAELVIKYPNPKAPFLQKPYKDVK